MKNLNKRISELEQAAKQRGGYLVVWRDQDNPGVYWEHPQNGGRQYNQADIDEIQKRLEHLIIVERVGVGV